MSFFCCIWFFFFARLVVGAAAAAAAAFFRSYRLAVWVCLCRPAAAFSKPGPHPHHPQPPTSTHTHTHSQTQMDSAAAAFWSFAVVLVRVLSVCLSMLRRLCICVCVCSGEYLCVRFAPQKYIVSDFFIIALVEFLHWWRIVLSAPARSPSPFSLLRVFSPCATCSLSPYRRGRYQQRITIPIRIRKWMWMRVWPPIPVQPAK